MIAGVAPPSLHAQAVLAGVVRADSNRALLPRVEVLLEQTAFHTTTDSAGRFVLPGLSAGVRVVLFRAIGWRPVRLSVRLVAGDTTHAEVSMVVDAVQLAPVTTTAEVKRPRGIGVEAFEERRRMGFGKFLDSAALHRHDTRNLGDILRTIPGLTIVVPPPCSRIRPTDCESDRSVRVAVSNRLVHRERCLLQVVLDGLQVNRGGELIWENAFDLNTLRVDQLYAVEVYRSAGEIPAEYNNANAACGVLVLWSKRLLP